MTGSAVSTPAVASPPDEVVSLLHRLTATLLVWSYEGTFRAEETIRRVGRAYGVEADATVGADSAILTVGDRTASFSHAPTVPPLDQVSDFRGLLENIEDGRLSPAAASTRLDALLARPPRFSKAWQVVGLGLFATGFGISVQATGQEIVASAVLGLLVGILAVAAQDRPHFVLVAPFVASVLVSTLVLVALPAFRLLVPGTIGLIGLTEIVGDNAEAGSANLSAALVSIPAVALGILVGTMVVRAARIAARSRLLHHR